MPYSTAQLCPTVIDMSMAGASGVGGCDNEYHGSMYSSLVKATRLRPIGAVDSDSAPPASTARFIPDAICPAAIAMADRLEAHCRLSATPGKSVNPKAAAM